MKSLRYEIEDHLQANNVFINAMTGRSAHIASYMTILDYDNLLTVFKQNKYTIQQLEVCIPEWMNDGYLSPIYKLLSMVVDRYIKTGEI